MISCRFEGGNEADSGLRHVVADVLVLREGKILLVKRTGRLLEGGKWALVGGFVDRGETIAQAAVREVQEETGWKVKDLRLLFVNDSPERPAEDRQNVAFVYTCQATAKVGRPDDESDDQQWFALDRLPDPEQLAFDHAAAIDRYKVEPEKVDRVE